VKRSKTQVLLAGNSELSADSCNCPTWPDCFHWAGDPITTEWITHDLGDNGHIAAEQRADLLAGRPVVATPAERREARRYWDALRMRKGRDR
jgi:hypothetical protein